MPTILPADAAASAGHTQQAPSLTPAQLERSLQEKIAEHVLSTLTRPALAHIQNGKTDRSASDTSLVLSTSASSVGTSLRSDSPTTPASQRSTRPGTPGEHEDKQLQGADVRAIDLLPILELYASRPDLPRVPSRSSSIEAQNEHDEEEGAESAHVSVAVKVEEEQSVDSVVPNSVTDSSQPLKVPAQLPTPDGRVASPESNVESREASAHASSTSSSDLSLSVEGLDKKAGPSEPATFWNRHKISVQAFFRRHYYIQGEPDIVLPSPPSDHKKLDFVQTFRPLLVGVGVFAFLANSTGIWFFATAAPPFFWYSVIAAFLQVYLGLFYLMGCFSRNFDHKNHERVKSEFAVNEVNAPTVDVYLPCCNEPLEVLENTYKYAKQLEYPAGKLQVHVLDDGSAPEVKQMAESYGFNHIVRDDRGRLKKAGNLRWAFQRTSGDFFVIFDADFCPRTDFLTKLIPRMMEDKNIAIIQTPQYFRSLGSQTWVERGAGAVQELFYQFIQTNRDKWGGAICVGSNAVYRREALADVGGTAEVGASEDVHTGFYAVTRGWRLAYIPINLACGICPDTPRAYFSQQVRWCQGSTSLLLNKHFWVSPLTKMQKMCYLSGMMYYSATAMGIISSPLPGLLLVLFRVELIKIYNLAFALPVIVYGIVVFRLWSRTAHSLSVQKIGIIQQYAYFSALKDRVLGTSFDWVPSGGNSTKHRSTRYRNMRFMCITWVTTYQSAFFGVIIWRLLQGYTWWYFVPLMVLSAYNLFIALPFMLSA
ncbi:glycosyltransferase family 2 protein [Ceraceosorus bombacis]|uniref:Glycosyltransferase family 2 protein n=1 Tax=Ceraceosorus bombacis TaxID=401625 RepID=A0A0P1B7W7_9BASI|nr:glycosyltransferase family 2 protein [Ceraceosorus bombacis]